MKGTQFSKRLDTLRVILLICAFALFISFRSMPGGLSGKRAMACGVVRAAFGSQDPIPGARVTVFNDDLTLFWEARTDQKGAYRIDNIPAGTYWIGVSAVRGATTYQYQSAQATIQEGGSCTDFFLDVDQNQGRWATIGSTEPENLDLTGSAILLPNGTIFYCHDATTPVVFDPVKGTTQKAPSSSSRQGCHGPCLLAEGLALLVGGGPSPGEAVATVKGFYPFVWDEDFSPMNMARWYPGITALSDGRYLVMGGNTRNGVTAACEIFSPKTRTWEFVASMSQPSDYPPAVLLSTGPNRGKVLRSFPRPQLFNPATNSWENTGGLLQPNRYPGHSDHNLNLLPDGRAMLVGIRRDAGSVATEIYDPTVGQWQLGPNLNHPRMMPHTVLLPDGKLLTMGGHYTGGNPPPPTGRNASLKSVELFDPTTNSWRLLADMSNFRDLHALATVVPDGRVVITSGAVVGPQPDFSIEALEPPYLFRGVRPSIDTISSTEFSYGGNFTMTVSLTNAVTKVVLLGTNAVTHWIDGGIPRYVQLPFQQSGSPLQL